MKGTNINMGEEITIKLEYIGDNIPILKYKANIYKDLSSRASILHVY